MKNPPSPPVFDPIHDVYSLSPHPLSVIFSPKSVAVIGASEKEHSVGRALLSNLIQNPFGGTVYPVNPNRKSVLGIRAYPDIQSLPETVDLAVIATPAEGVPEVVRACANADIPGAIIISAGFKEVGKGGQELEEKILEVARASEMSLIGPNCLGVMNTRSNLNATFAHAMAKQGNVAFLSQSGALCTAVLDWSLKANVGFSLFASVGSMLDVGWGDLIEYLGDDPYTESIVIYMETVGNARTFMSSAREVALTKPILVIKPGRTQAASRAAVSHTGSLTGSDEVIDAAFHRSGVLRLDSIAEMFSMAEMLAKQPRPKGPRLAILTNAGGPGVLASDALLLSGGRLAEVSEETLQKLGQFLPPQWSHNNPVDILGDAGPERYAKAIEVLSNDEANDGLLAILTPQAMTQPSETAEALRRTVRPASKPLLTSWMGGGGVSPGIVILKDAGLPTFSYPDDAARAFSAMWRFSEDLHSLYETPRLTVDASKEFDRNAASKVLEEAKKANRTVLNEVESKRLLEAYGIPTVPTLLASSPKEAKKLAEMLGFPVVLKLHSNAITHKTDVGGVCLNLKTPEEVLKAFVRIQQSIEEKVGPGHFLGVSVQPMVDLKGYELILGSSTDSQFGPVILFGAGGVLVEVFKDQAIGLPPLTDVLARRIIEKTKISAALKGIRGRAPMDMAMLETLLVRFSWLIAEQRRIVEFDINPLLASSSGTPSFMALDARVLLADPGLPDALLPTLAIRPYPERYFWRHTTKTDMAYTLRPIRPEDVPKVQHFHEMLSDRSVSLRYLSPVLLQERTRRERLVRACFIDYDKEIALVAETTDGDVIAIGRLRKLPQRSGASFSLLVADPYQRQGIGTEMLTRLVEIAKQEGLAHLFALMTPENELMRRMLEKFGFRLHFHRKKTGLVEGELAINSRDRKEE